MKESIKNTSFTTKDLIQGHPERKILQIICNDFNVDFFKKGNEKYWIGEKSITAGALRRTGGSRRGAGLGADDGGGG